MVLDYKIIIIGLPLELGAEINQIINNMADKIPGIHVLMYILGRYVQMYIPGRYVWMYIFCICI